MNAPSASLAPVERVGWRTRLAWLAAALRFLGSRKTELLILVLGVVLRISMVTNYRFDWNYDSLGHWQVIEWMLEHRTIPGSETVFSSFHPPLYYALAAWLIDHGWTRPDLMYASLAFGIAQLVLLWVGLELWLPRRRVARVSALALSAVLCASVHIDGMIYAEPLSGLLHLIIFIVAPFALARDTKLRLPLGLLLGLLLGVALLVKISALVTLGALGLAVAFRLLLVKQEMKRRALEALGWAGVAGIVLLTCSWYFMQNIHQYGRPTVTSFDLPSQKWLMSEAEEKGVLDRRSLGYLFGWSRDIHLSPYRPSANRPTPRFFPSLIASAVVDYWNFGYAGYASATSDTPWARRSSSVALPEESRAAMFGGTAIFAAMFVAGVCAGVEVWKRRDAGRLFLLAAPALTLAAAIHFAVVHPIDHYGVVKAAYLMFAAPGAYALFGLAVDWGWRRRLRRPLAGLLGTAVLTLGCYSVKARLSTHYPWESAAATERKAIADMFSKGPL